MKIEKQTVQQIVDRILIQEKGSQISIWAPVIRGKKGEHKTTLTAYHKLGFLNAKVDGEYVSTEQTRSLERYKKHTIEILVDELQVAEQEKGRMAESLQTALNLSDGVVTVTSKNGSNVFSERLACPICGVNIEELEPRRILLQQPLRRV